MDSYGYKVAAAMLKITEEALGGQYTITVNPYPFLELRDRLSANVWFASMFLNLKLTRL